MLGKFGTLIAAHKLAAGIIIGTVAVGGTAGGVVVHNHVQEVKAEEQRQAEIDKMHMQKAEASKVDKVILAIGNVTLDKETSINDAEKAYDALSSGAKSYVKEKKTLNDARISLQALKDQAKADKVAAQTVMDKINAIGNVTLDSETIITDARTSFNALSDAQKALVTNAGTLNTAESTLQGLKDAQAQAQAQAQANAKAAATAKKAATTKGNSSAPASTAPATKANTNNTTTTKGDGTLNNCGLTREQIIQKQQEFDARDNARIAGYRAAAAAEGITDEEYYQQHKAEIDQANLEFSLREAKLSNPNAYYDPTTNSIIGTN